MGLRERDRHQSERVEEDNVEKIRCRVDGSRVQEDSQRTAT